MKKLIKKFYIYKILNLKINLIIILGLSNPLFGEIDLTTIDSWKIVNAGTHTLLVTKFSEKGSKNSFLFHIERPYCLCQTPSFVLYNPNDEKFIRPQEDERITAELKVDFNKIAKVELEVFLASEEGQTNLLRLKGNFPSIRDVKVLELDSIYGSDKWILKNLDNAMRQAKKICETFIPYEEEAIKTRGKKV